jgi:hypothetical protein
MTGRAAMIMAMIVIVIMGVIVIAVIVVRSEPVGMLVHVTMMIMVVEVFRFGPLHPLDGP